MIRFIMNRLGAFVRKEDFLLRFGFAFVLATVAVSCHTSRVTQPPPTQTASVPGPEENARACLKLARAYADGLNGATNEIEAAKLFRKAANLNNPEAMNALGRYYCAGRGGLPIDPVEGFSWFRKAAELNHAPSKVALALSYTSGLGTTVDFAEALKWFRQAADQGEPDGQAFLGHMLREGQHVSKDILEAEKWFRLCAEQGFDSGQNALGYAYATGQGANQDFVEAYKWYSLAQVKGNRNAEVNMRNLLPRLTQDQITAGKAAAAAFSPKVSIPAQSNPN